MEGTDIQTQQKGSGLGKRGIRERRISAPVEGLGGPWQRWEERLAGKVPSRTLSRGVRG